MADLAVWQRTIVDEKGDIIPGAEVSVRSYPGGSLITLYEGPDGVQVKGNPFSTGADGFARFWAESQRAEIVAHGAGSTIRWIVDLLNADEVIGGAVSEATAAAAVAVGEAEAAADRAEAARDAAQLNARIYKDTDEGIAKTTDGDYFSVPGSGDDYLVLYRNDGGAAEEINRVPSVEAVEALVGTAEEALDWDNITKSGFYRGSDTAGETIGAPDTEIPNPRLLHIRGHNNRANQLAFRSSGNDPKVWVRSRGGAGNWSQWEELAWQSKIDVINDTIEPLTGTAKEALDWDSIDEIGFYRGGAVEETIGSPDQEIPNPRLLHIKAHNNRANQLAFRSSGNDPKVWVRSRGGAGVWSQWEELAWQSGVDVLRSAISGLAADVPLPEPRTAGYLAVTGGVVALDGKGSPNAEGFVIPAGQTGTAHFFTLSSMPPGLTGYVVRFAATYEATPGLLDEMSLDSGVFRTDRGSGSQIRSVVASDITQDGAIITQTADYEVHEDDIRWGLRLFMEDVASEASDRSLRLVSYSMEIVESPAGQPGALAKNVELYVAERLGEIKTLTSATPTGAKPRILCDVAETVLDLDFSLTTPAMEITQARTPLVVPETAWEIDPPSTESVVDHEFSLRYSTAANVPGVRLPHQYVTDPVVTRLSDNTQLVQGVDYDITPDRGYIYGLVDNPNTPCKISYTGHLHRYDIITIDQDSGSLSLTKGDERIVDPEEWKPGVPVGNVLLWTVYVNRHGCDLLPSWRYLAGVDAFEMDAYGEWLRWCRSCLPKLTSKLRTGQPIKVAAYGSSSLAMGPGTRDDWGGDRDRVAFWERAPQDTLGKYPEYDTSDPDFAVNGGTVSHTKEGMAWGFIEGLRDKWGADVTYHNWAVGGTRATSDGGLDPAWLGNVIADAPDVVILGFANGIGGSWQYANNRQIVEAFQAAGIEVILLTTPRLNAYGTPDTSAWRRTHDDLVRVALDTGSAYVSTYVLEGPGREGGCGLSPKNMSNGNLYNHGGPLQYATVRRLLWEMVP